MKKALTTFCIICMIEDKQIWIDQPELLSEYPHVHIIKGKFEK